MTWSSFPDLRQEGRSTGSLGGHDRTTDRRGGVAHEVDDDVGDRGRRDRVREQVRREVLTAGGVEQLWRDAVHPDPERAQSRSSTRVRWIRGALLTA
jgi:hypothetical protein